MSDLPPEANPSERHCQQRGIVSLRSADKSLSTLLQGQDKGWAVTNVEDRIDHRAECVGLMNGEKIRMPTERIRFIRTIVIELESMP